MVVARRIDTGNIMGFIFSILLLVGLLALSLAMREFVGQQLSVVFFLVSIVVAGMFFIKAVQ